MEDIENTSVEATENETLNNEDSMTEEQELEASADADSEGEAVEAKKKSDAHLAFIAAATAHAEALGLQSKDQKSFVQVWNAETGMKLYVAKQSKGVTRIDTTLPKDALPGISYDLSKPNGRIQCHVEPSLENVLKALDVLASYEGKIPAPKKAAKAETEAEVVATE